MKNNWKKNITLFLVGQIISLFGSSLVQYAITWYITLETKSGTMMMISILCGFLPTFFLSPFAGVWADRFNKKVLIIISDALIAISTLVLAILFLLGYDNIWLLFVISAIRAIGSGIHSPAISAILPYFVPSEKLTKINSIKTTLQSVIMVVSPILSGLLLTFSSISLIFFIDVITAAIAIYILLFIHYEDAKPIEFLKITYFKDLKEGLRYIKKHSFILYFCIFNLFFFILIAPAAFLTPLQVARSFGEEVWRLTAIEIAYSSGMILGGVIIGIWKGFKNKVHTMVFANLIVGICTIGIGITQNFWVYIAIMVVFGVAFPIFNIPATVMFQQKIDKEYLGRVFSVLGMITSIMMPIGMLGFGPLSDYVLIEHILIVTGLFILVLSIFMLENKVMIKAGSNIQS